MNQDKKTRVLHPASMAYIAHQQTIRRHNAHTVSEDITAARSKTSWMVYQSDCHGQAQDELRFQGEISRDEDAGNGRVDRMSAKGAVAQDEQVLFRD